MYTLSSALLTAALVDALTAAAAHGTYRLLQMLSMPPLQLDINVSCTGLLRQLFCPLVGCNPLSGRLRNRAIHPPA